MPSVALHEGTSEGGRRFSQAARPRLAAARPHRRGLTSAALLRKKDKFEYSCGAVTVAVCILMVRRQQFNSRACCPTVRSADVTVFVWAAPHTAARTSIVCSAVRLLADRS